VLYATNRSTALARGWKLCWVDLDWFLFWLRI